MTRSAESRDGAQRRRTKPARRVRDPLTRSEIMKRVKQKNSGAEVALRSALHGEGLRFRLHRRIEGIAVDIVLPGAKVAVLVDGCFWHGCPAHATYPKTNTSYWLPKLEENKERDRRQTARLEQAGWTVIRVWEHDCRPVNRRVVARIARACGKPAPGIGENGRRR
jgi:DNA mismatch endonuclease, patch repair protein